MDQKSRNTITRFEKVKSFLEANPAIVASVGALAAATASYFGLMALLPKGTAEGAEGDATALRNGVTADGLSGAREDKEGRRAALTQRLIPLMSALKLHYKKAGNLERAREMDLTRPSALGTLAASKYTALVALVRQYADELSADALKDYGQDDNEIKKFGLAADAFGIAKNAPTTYRDQRKVAGDQLEDHIDDVRDYLNDDLKSAVNLVATTHPDFVQGFKQANKTDDRKGKSAKKADDSPPPAAPHGSGVGS